MKLSSNCPALGKGILRKYTNNIYSNSFDVIDLKAFEKAETFIDRYSNSFE